MTHPSLACCLLSLLVGMIPPAPLSAQLSRSSDYVRLNGGQRFDGTVNIVRRQGNLVVQLNHQALYPLSEVTSLVSNGVFFITYHDARVHRGVATVDTKLLRRVAAGPLDLFMTYRPNKILVANKYDYFRKEDGPIQRVEYDNLRRALRDNPASAAMMDRSQRWRRLQRGLFVVGGALLGYGLYRGFHRLAIGKEHTRVTEINGTRFRYTKRERRFGVHLTLPIGALLTLSGFIPLHKKKSLMRTAIETYNQP